MTQIALRNARQGEKRSVTSLVQYMFAVMRQRRRLKQLDDAALTDMGITREEAMEEARRYFWDAPNFWKR